MNKLPTFGPQLDDFMELTKEDYMRLPKERLAELLVERDATETTPIEVKKTTPHITERPWWKDWQITCQN